MKVVTGQRSASEAVECDQSYEYADQVISLWVRQFVDILYADLTSNHYKKGQYQSVQRLMAEENHRHQAANTIWKLGRKATWSLSERKKKKFKFIDKVSLKIFELFPNTMKRWQYNL
jgi:hypothetical protein